MKCEEKSVPLPPLKSTGCSTVGSAPRSGRGGRQFESVHPDRFLGRESMSAHFLDLCFLDPIPSERNLIPILGFSNIGISDEGKLG